MANADDSGTCGDNLTWTYVEATHTLTISGEGSMRNYSSDYLYAFIPWYDYRNKITKVIIEDGVTSIGEYAFYYCSGLTSVTIGNSVISIGDNAFSYCSGLTSVTIGNSVISIGDCAFSGCSGLASVHVADLAAWCGILFENDDANPLNLAHHLSMNGNEVTDLVIPFNVESIGKYAFSGCTALTSVTIPNSVTSIEQYAFNGCI